MSTYRRDYLKSEHWKSFRLFTLTHRPHCENCGLSRDLCRLFYLCDLDIHHLNYKCLGKESQSDVRVLCRGCHEIEEIPKHWPGYMCFLGLPQFYATCPSCSEEIFLSIPMKDHYHSKDGHPVYVPGEPYGHGCECCEDDFAEFIADNLWELMAERKETTQ